MMNLRHAFIPQSLQKNGPRNLATDEYMLLPNFTESPLAPSDQKKAKRRWRDGHHFGVLCCAITAATVLFINIIIALIASVKHNIVDGIGILKEGDCNEIKRVDLWVHLLINVLSTLLLGASNYTMQCLSSPTRRDIDEAHRQHIWMDIGVPSARNILRISWPRKLLWCFLACSSVPLHLLYNSVIYSTLSLSEYSIFGVGADFLSGATFSIDPQLFQEVVGSGGNDAESLFRDRLTRLQNSTSLVRLDNEACVSAYTASLVSEWGDVLLVSNYKNPNNSFFNVWTSSHGFRDEAGFMPLCEADSNCGVYETPDPRHLSTSADYYDNHAVPVMIDHCMAMKAQQHCTIRFSTTLMIAVIICNIVKVTCMAVIVWKADPKPLVTLGDAIASFLDTPDLTTTKSCLSSKINFNRKSRWTSHPLRYYPYTPRWFASASLNRWLITTISCVIVLGAATGLLVLGTRSAVQHTTINAFSLGFGAANTSATLSIGYLTVIANLLVANSPQVLLSILYFSYNSLWTCMLLTREWINYAKERKPLRVTSAIGGQRSTYRLQLPYRYGVPLLVTAGILHWLVSQSIFLVVLEAYTYKDMQDPDGDGITCGYSPIAILTVVLTGTLVLALGIGYGFRRYKMNGIPLAGTCSAAISAACHPPPGDEGASEKAVMWGVCKTDEPTSRQYRRDSTIDEEDENVSRLSEDEWMRVGHCSFTSLNVHRPLIGRLYAGLPSSIDT